MDGRLKLQAAAIDAAQIEAERLIRELEGRGLPTSAILVGILSAAALRAACEDGPAQAAGALDRLAVMVRRIPERLASGELNLERGGQHGH